MESIPARGQSPAYAIAEPLQAGTTTGVPQVSVAPERIALAIGYVVIAISVIVLIGWVFSLEFLKSIVPGGAKMAPATAVCFLLAGTALVVLCPKSGMSLPTGFRVVVARTLASIVTSIGVLKLGDYLFGWSLNFDTLGFSDPASVAPSTAFNFLLVGTALLLGSGDRVFIHFQNLALGTMLVAWIGFASFLAGGERLPVYAQMALHTSLAFFFLSIGILCTRTDRGLMALLTGRSAAGRKILWLLAMAPLIPLVIELIEKTVDEDGRFGTVNFAPIFAVLDTVLLAALIWAFGVQIQRIDERRSKEQAKRREYETRLALFVEHAPAAIAMFDHDMRFLAVSRRWLSDFGRTLEDIRGQNYYEVFPQASERWHEIHRRCLAGNVERNDKDQLTRSDGLTDWVRWEVHPWSAAEGDIGGIIQFNEVITNRVVAEEKIKRLNRVYAVLSEINSLIVRTRDSQALFEEACRIAVEMGDFGVAWAGMYHRDTDAVVPVAAAGLPLDHPLLADTAGRLAGRAIASGNPEFVNDLLAEKSTNDSGDQAIADQGFRAIIALPLIVDEFSTGCITMWSRRENVFDDDELKLLREIANDIAFALQYLTKQEELDYVSYYDVLTGLPNRALFSDRVSQELRARGGKARTLAVLVMDIERFRNVNDTLGRHGGDELLRALAKRLESSQLENTMLARVGPNTFAAIVTNADQPSVVAHLIEQMMLTSCKAPFMISGTEIRIAVKVGAALYPSDGQNADELFRNAEVSLKRAKDTGQPFLFYNVEMNARTARKLTLETRLRKAIESNEFTLFYQPKVRLDTSELSGLEALIRWNDPDRGLVSPSEFIPILEETGLIVEVGRWAIKHAIGDYRQWVSAGYRVPRIAVNVSPNQLQRDGFVSEVLDLVQMPGADPDALELEITESLIMQNIDSSNRALSVLRGVGIQVAMDDFGTGYSSLRYLASLPVDKIKIDRSFIAGMTENALDGKIVSTIISLAHSFGLPVVAEGVETVEQAQVLHTLECEEAQGFLFSRPMPADEIVDLFGSADSLRP